MDPIPEAAQSATAVAITGVFALLLLGGLVKKLIDFGKAILSGDKNGWATQLIVFVVGVAVLSLASQANLFNAVALPLGDGNEVVLGKLDWASIIILGLCVSSIASFVQDKRNADDNSIVTIPNTVVQPPKIE